MAEDKNSIIVYADWIDKFEDLTDEEAGILIKHFFRYVNDLNPPSLTDRLLKMAFNDIEKSLKRDLKKWEAIKAKRSEAGKASAEAKKIAKQNLTKSTSVESVDSISTKSTVSVSDSVNVSVSVSDSEINNLGVDVFYDEFLEEKKELFEAIKINFGFQEQRFVNHWRTITAFVNKLYSDGLVDDFKEQFKNYHEYKKLSGEKLHSFQGLIGKPENRFEDARWNAENWANKILALKSKPNNQSKFEKTMDVFTSLKQKLDNGN